MTYRPYPADVAADIDAPIVYLVPSRGRPANAVELVAAWDATLSAVPAANLVIVLDDDDPALDGYADAFNHGTTVPEWCEVIIGPRYRLGPTLNRLAPVFAAGRTAVGFMGDDHRPRTLRWDERLDELHNATPLAVVYGNDLVRGADLPTAVSIDARIIGELGYMVPPDAVHLYLDDYWRRLGTDLGTLVYADDLVIEHCHPTAGTAPFDDRYAEVNAAELYAADEATFLAHLVHVHPDDIARLTALKDSLTA